MIPRIPEYFGIDGRALPPDVGKYGAKKRIVQDDGFQALLDEETRKLKERKGEA